MRFKDHRLSSINPRTGKPISAKTVKDSDLSGLKTLFGWAVSNRRLPSNPVTGITIKLGKPQKLRGKGLTEEEAKAILQAALKVTRGGESAGTFAAKMPIPVKPPVCNGMIAPRDSWMMPPPCNEMIPPGAPRLLAERVSSPCGVAGQAVLDCLPRVRRRLSPVNSMRCALWTRRSRMASA